MSSPGLIDSLRFYKNLTMTTIKSLLKLTAPLHNCSLTSATDHLCVSHPHMSPQYDKRSNYCLFCIPPLGRKALVCILLEFEKVIFVQLHNDQLLSGIQSTSELHSTFAWSQNI